MVHIVNIFYSNTAKCCNIYCVTKCYKLIVFQKCRLCTISSQTRLTTRWQDCLGNYNWVFTESDIQHCVFTCKYKHIWSQPICFVETGRFLKLKNLQRYFNFEQIWVDDQFSYRLTARKNVMFLSTSRISTLRPNSKIIIMIFY